MAMLSPSTLIDDNIDFPTSVKVGPFTYEIEEWDPTEALQNGHLGQCDTLNLVIKVQANLPSMRKVEVLLHEIMHAAWDVVSLPGSVEEETAVNALAIALTGVFRDNPDIMRWIEAEMEGQE